MRIALFQPDIANNVGAVIRLGACFGTPVDVIEPCGFPFSLRAVRRAAMDYADGCEIAQHDDWSAFQKANSGRRIVLLSTKARRRFEDFDWRKEDVLLIGRESAGVPAEVYMATSAQVRIPMAPGARSLNMAMSAAVALAEALKQTDGLPEDGEDHTA